MSKIEGAFWHCDYDRETIIEALTYVCWHRLVSDVTELEALLAFRRALEAGPSRREAEKWKPEAGE